MIFPETLEETLFLAPSWFWWLLAFLSPSSHDLLLISVSFSLDVNEFRAYVDNPRLSHLKMFNYICKDLFSIQSHIHSFQVLGYKYIFWGTTIKWLQPTLWPSKIYIHLTCKIHSPHLNTPKYLSPLQHHV